MDALPFIIWLAQVRLRWYFASQQLTGKQEPDSVNDIQYIGSRTIFRPRPTTHEMKINKTNDTYYFLHILSFVEGDF